MTEATNNGNINQLGSKKNLYSFLSPINDKFCTPDRAPKCTWRRDIDPATSPHSKVEWRRPEGEKIFSDAMKAVGNTPMIRLNKIPQSYGLECDVYVKCEFFNPGGSVKDRIGFRMIEDAEKAGFLKPGSTIIEPSSGNTGIGLALGAAIKGYRCIIVMSEKMSNEKVDVLKALGAEVHRVPITYDSFHPEGLFGITHRLKQEIPNSIILDQYCNPSNPLAHYDNTAEEIFDQCDKKVDMIVIGAGTGGTATGVAKKFKEISPSTIIVGADPEGSILAQPESLNKTDTDFYEVEGIGYDFIPTGFNRSIIDRWMKVQDKESLLMARRLIKDEGLLCGGSSGAAVVVAMKSAAGLKKGQKCVVILPDSIRNYLTKFVSDVWMEARGLQPCPNVNNHWWWEKKVADLEMEILLTVSSGTTIERVMAIMKKQGIDQMPVVDKNGGIVSMVTMQKLLSALTVSSVHPKDTIERACSSLYPKVASTAILGLVSRILEREPYVVVLEKQSISNGATIEKPLGIITPVDLLQYISSN